MAQEVAPLALLDDEIYTTTIEGTRTTGKTLGCLLSNHLVLCQTLPYLAPAAVLSLAATSRAFRDLIHDAPAAFRHLDLTRVKAARFDIDPIDSGGELWHNTQLDEHLTEDEFYSGPLRGIFSNLSRSNLLASVHTLVLDGLSVTAELVHDILTGPAFNIRILSLRDVKNLNEHKLQQALQTACRPSRPEGTPRLKAIYLFTRRDGASAATRGSVFGPALAGGGSSGSTSASSAPASAFGLGTQRNSDALPSRQEQPHDEGDAWYGRHGKMLARSISPEWAHTLLACRGIIAFDAVLCAGPRHPNSPAFGIAMARPGVHHHEPIATAVGPQFAVATHAVGGCSGCVSAPEGRTVWGRSSSEEFPLLAPAPLHSSSLRAACCPSGGSLENRETVRGWGSIGDESDAQGPPSFVARCFDCLKGRYCWSCNKWWCEACYAGPGNTDDKCGVSKSCWECGDNCHDCISKTQLMCKSCCGGYCIIHNEGSSLTYCDWCSKGSRRTRELY